MTKLKIPFSELETQTKKTFALGIADICNSKAQAKQVVQAFVNVLEESIIVEGYLRLINIGTFVVEWRGERSGVRNPKTGDEYVLPAHKTVKFGRSFTKKEREVYFKKDKKGKNFIADKMKEKVAFIAPSIIDEALNRFLSLIKFVDYGVARLEIRGLGVFYPIRRPAGNFFNPKTREPVYCEAKTSLKFKPSKSLIKKLNQ